MIEREIGFGSLLGNPEDILGGILVAVFGISALFLQQHLMPLLEGVGDVLQEDQPQRDVLVLGLKVLRAEELSARDMDAESKKPSENARFTPRSDRKAS